MFPISFFLYLEDYILLWKWHCNINLILCPPIHQKNCCTSCLKQRAFSEIAVTHLHFKYVDKRNIWQFARWTRTFARPFRVSTARESLGKPELKSVLEFIPDTSSRKSKRLNEKCCDFAICAIEFFLTF